MADEFMLERAYAEDDAAKRDYEQGQDEQPRLLEPHPAGVDAEEWWLARRRRAVEKQQSFRQQHQLNAEASKAWNDWFREMLDIEMQPDGMLCENVAYVISELRREWREEFKAEIAKVYEEVAGVRADMNLQTGIQRGEIKELKGDVPARRRKDVA